MMTATRIDRGSTDTTTIYSEDGDLVYERVFEAPRELVDGSLAGREAAQDRPPGRVGERGERGSECVGGHD